MIIYVHDASAYNQILNDNLCFRDNMSYKSTLRINSARRRILCRFCFVGIIMYLCIQREKPLVNYRFAHSLQPPLTYKHITWHVRAAQPVTCSVFKNVCDLARTCFFENESNL